MRCFLLVSVISVALMACNREKSIDLNESTGDDVLFDYQMSLKDVTNLLLDFIYSDASVKSGQESDGGQVFETTITGYKVRDYVVACRANEVETQKNVSVPVFEITTMTNGVEGYSVVIADSRISRVLISVEQGSLKDTLSIVPLREYFRAIPEFISNGLEAFYKKNVKEKVETPTKSFVVTTIYAFLPTTWGQTVPYNRKCQKCFLSNSPFEYNTPTGAVPVAIGQIMAYHKKTTSYITSSDWNSILASAKIDTISSSEEVISKVSTLLAEIGNKANTVYNCATNGATNVGTDAANALAALGMMYNSRQSFSLYTVKESLTYSRPVFMDGFSSGWDVWVCDGSKQHDYYDYGYHEVYEYLSLNWGFNGTSNGFYYFENYPLSLNSKYYSYIMIIPHIR